MECQERIEGLRQLIHEQVARSDIHAKVSHICLSLLDPQKIRMCITDMLADGSSDMSEEHIRKVLRERGLVDDVLKSLGFSNEQQSEKSAQKLPIAEPHFGIARCSIVILIRRSG
jgi:hypothetical protein